MILVSVIRLVVLLMVIPILLLLTWWVTKISFRLLPGSLGWEILRLLFFILFGVATPLFVIVLLVAWTFERIDPWSWGALVLLWAVPALSICIRNSAVYGSRSKDLPHKKK